MPLRQWVTLAVILVSALTGVSGCTTDSGSNAEPTAAPASEETAPPIAEPTEAPTAEPTEMPTLEPAEAPTAEPTETPTAEPTEMPTPEPTAGSTPEPVATPATEPATTPTPKPTAPATPAPLSRAEADDAVVVGRLQWSPDGSQILVPSGFYEHETPVDVVEADGSRLSRLWGVNDVTGDLASGYAGPMSTFDLSADGSKIVYSTCAYAVSSNEEYEIVVSNIDGTDTRRLTENFGAALYPVWSPDGTRVAFVSPPALKIYTVATGEWIYAPGYIDHPVVPIPPAWSPDGGSIAFLAYATRPDNRFQYWEASTGGARVDVYTVGPDGSDLKRIVSNAVSAPSWSPDGERMAVAVSDGGEVALYTFAADGSDPAMVARIDAKDMADRRDRVSDPAALWVPNVSWSPDGSKIMYGALSVVNVDDGSVVLDTQAIRFEWVGSYGTRVVDYENAGAFPLAAWSPDGSRIAMLAPVSPAWQMSYAELESYPFMYTMNSDGTDPRILAGWKEGGRVAWPVPVRLPADVEACSKGVVVRNPEENPGLVKDCRTLLGMRDQLAGSGTLAWSSDTLISRWLRVGVSGGRVRTLHISDFSFQGELYGQIPPEIGNLDGLRELTIDWTHINGRIPREIGKLANLESLEVAFTHMGGSIPAEIGNLTNLKWLVLTASQFSGSIPAEIGNLVNLEVMDLQNNNISGHIPPEIGKLVNLKVLALQDFWGANSGLLTGPIPPELGNMVSLERLLLTGHRLSGSIPAELGNLTNLTGLYLEGNELSGCIPQALRDLPDSDIHRLLLRYCE